MKNTKIFLPKETVVPNHVAIILDGNRRWARARGLNLWEGHRAGAKAIFDTVEASREFGVHTLTIWAFSTENWDRPKQEIDQIMLLIEKYLKIIEKECHRYRIKFVHIGRKDRLPRVLIGSIAKLEKNTENYTRQLLNLALDYGGKDEIVRAIKKIVTDKMQAKEIDTELVESYLDTRDQPYPYVDLFIRTSGEQRTSGLMPWQMEYAEYYWEQGHLPEFTPEKLKTAILDYSRRRRRFGGNDVVEHFYFKPELTAKLELAWWRLANVPESVPFHKYAMMHLREQYGLSKILAGEAAKYLGQAILEEKRNKWLKAKSKMKAFYKLIKEEVKLAFEPEIVASLEVRMRREVARGDEGRGLANETAKELVGEIYRISLFQAAKAAHLRVLATAEAKLGNWSRAENYLKKYYAALKDRIA